MDTITITPDPSRAARLYGEMKDRLADSLEYIATWQTGMFQTADMMESFAAKSEKRDPEFDDILPVPKGL